MQFTTEEFRDELLRIAGEIESDPMEVPLSKCDVIAKQAIRDNFTSSATPDNENWLPRKPRKGDDGHPILIDKGPLLQAATGGGPGHISRIESRSLAVGVDLDVVKYARAHNYGVPERNLPQREYLGMRKERADECSGKFAEYVEREIIG